MDSAERGQEREACPPSASHRHRLRLVEVSRSTQRDACGVFKAVSSEPCVRTACRAIRSTSAQLMYVQMLALVLLVIAQPSLVFAQMVGVVPPQMVNFGPGSHGVGGG